MYKKYHEEKVLQLASFCMVLGFNLSAVLAFLTNLWFLFFGILMSLIVFVICQSFKETTLSDDEICLKKNALKNLKKVYFVFTAFILVAFIVSTTYTLVSIIKDKTLIPFLSVGIPALVDGSFIAIYIFFIDCFFIE